MAGADGRHDRTDVTVRCLIEVDDKYKKKK